MSRSRKEDKTEPTPIESHYETVEKLFNDFDATPNDPNYKEKWIENGRIRITITKVKDEEKFNVRVGDIRYHISKKGVHEYITGRIKTANGLVVPNSSTSIFVYTPIAMRVAAEDLVSWTARIVSADLVLPFPYQPRSYIGERPTRQRPSNNRG